VVSIEMTLTRPSLSVAIARTFGLCCGFGVIVGVVSWLPVAFDWNAKARRNAEAELTPTPSDLVYVVSVSERRIGTYSTTNAARKASAKDATNDILWSVTCGSSIYGHLPGCRKESQRF
jgi:hypothetical protein